MRLILAAALVAAPLAAFADDDPKTVALEARHGYYQMLGVNMGTLAGMAKGDVAYDETAASLAAANIEALSRYDVTIHFVPGTAKGEMEDSEAKPEAVSDLPGLKTKLAALQEAATGAAEAVKGGQGNVGPVVQRLGAACKSCHQAYRAE